MNFNSITGKIVALLFSICCHADSLAVVREIFSLKEAQEVLALVDHNALVVFDTDETLIVSVDKIRRRHPESILSDIRQAYFYDVDLQETRRDYLDSIKLKMAAQKLIEPESAALIGALQARNVRVITITHIHAGSYCAIESMQEWRYKQLCDLGIDLSINNPTTIVLDNLPMGRSSFPVFYKGVLPTSKTCTKGQALAELIKRLNFRPSSVVFFDDYMEHIETVHQEMAQLGIPCTAFHYRVTERMQEPADVELAIFQYKYLIEHEQWLSDIQARALMAITTQPEN